MHKARQAFTLIEVMVSVVIISIVIMALLELFANNSHIFSSLSKKSQTDQYMSFVIANPDYGFEDKTATLYDLVKEFDIESELKRELKAQKIELIYQELESIDMSESELDVENEDELEKSSSSMVFEIGKSIVKLPDSSTSLLRIKLQ